MEDCFMMRVLPYVLLGYLSGSLLWAKFYGRLVAKTDITALSPDGNPGASNAFQFGGFWCGCLTLCCDILKGSLPVMLYRRGAADFPAIGLAFVMAAPVVGHAYSIFHRFRGGKGIAVSFGCLLGLAPDLRPALVLAVVFIVFSVVIRISPHYYRTLATYVVAVPVLFQIVPVWPIRAGFLLIAGTVILKLLCSKEEKEKLEVKLGWKS